jgi:hypothetical protein
MYCHPTKILTPGMSEETLARSRTSVRRIDRKYIVLYLGVKGMNTVEIHDDLGVTLQSEAA